MPNRSSLRRELGLWSLIAYGVGDILGAGIYALVGEVAGRAGRYAWLSFVVTIVLAGFTALSYAELGSRFPQSGGEASFCRKTIGWNWLATLVGFLVLCSGVASLATVSWAFVGYLLEAAPVQAASPLFKGSLLIGFVAVLGGINLWGIRQSSTVNIVCTVVEAAGLLTVVVVGAAYLMQEQAVAPPPLVCEPIAWGGVMQGSALAFFAFIGFEDMVNVSEEVRRPERNLPIAILVSLGVATTLYVAVVLVATAIVPPHELARSEAPLLEVIRRGLPDVSTWWFTVIALFAVANTGLLNFIMGSRLLYGMAGEGLLPGWLYAVHPKTETPHRTIGLVFLLAVALALSGSLAHLAGTANVLLLAVFATVNLSLVVLKRQGRAGNATFVVPIMIPLLGAASCILLIGFVPWRSLATAAAMVAAAGVVVVLFHRRARVDASEERR